MQKFKLLATQCAIASSPTRSPTTSPVVHLRRRKTLRMLLGRGGSGGGGGRRMTVTPRHDDVSTDRKQEVPERSVSNKLRDLFVSSPPAFGDRGTEREGLLMPAGGGGVGRRIGGGGGGGGRFVRPLSSTLRQRLLRRVWRPVLVAIPE